MNTATGEQRFTPSFWRHDWYPLRELRRALEMTLRQSGWPLAGQRIVDVGCGEQPYRPLFVAAGCDYVGCDLAPPADVVFTPGQPLPLPDGSADLVVSFQVLEHVWDLDWYLGECRRLLKPGGRLLLSTHGVWPYHAHPTDFRRWTRDGLCEELTTRGFHVETTTAIVGPLAWTTHFRLLGYREVLRRVPVLGPLLLPLIATVMNARTFLEDRITPASIRDVNAAVYVTLSRRTEEGTA